MSDPAPSLEAGPRIGVAPVDLLEQPEFRRELTPTWLSTSALLAGQPPLDPGRPLRFADLSCRSGVQAAVVAACHPDAEVWAVDDDPADLEQARRLARDAGLDNMAVAEWRQGPTGDVGLPEELDIVVLDDVISTVDAIRRAELADIVARRVRPGGLVAVTYRTVSGWAEIVPLRRLALLVAGGSDRPVSARIDATVNVLGRLVEGGASFIRDRAAVRDAVDAVLNGRLSRVERFLLTDHLEPLSLARVVDWLRPTGSTYIGSLRLGDEVGQESPLGALLADTADRSLREALHDLATRPAYRLDLFRRGSSPLTGTDRRALVGKLELIALTDVVDAAAGRWEAATVDELLLHGTTDVGADGVLRDLLARGLAHPRSCGWATTDPSPGCGALNAVLESCAPTPGGHPVQAIPAVGSAVRRP